MDRRSFLAISPAALIATPCIGQDQSTTRNDGNWWKGLNVLSKFGYVIGYAEGSAQTETNWSYGECRSKVTDKYLAAMQKVNDFGGIGVGQYVDGLDQFYSDFRNTKILVFEAIRVVKDQISGVSQKLIDENLQILRRDALDPHR